MPEVAAKDALLLLHSPLTGPQTWRLLAPLLRERGWAVETADFVAAMQGPPPYYDKLTDEALRVANGARDATLVVHSGAGAIVPAVAAANPDIGGAVFMDALLPHPGRSWRNTAPAALLTHLDGLTDAGRVPPWHAWWPKRSIASLFASHDDYSRFANSLKPLPAAYFDEIAPAIAMPASLRCSYLRLSEACETDAQEAEVRGWPVQRLSLNHLAMLTHAKQVCMALEGLLPAAPHAA